MAEVSIGIEHARERVASVIVGLKMKASTAQALLNNFGVPPSTVILHTKTDENGQQRVVRVEWLDTK
jgi:hypothetical protein